MDGWPEASRHRSKLRQGPPIHEFDDEVRLSCGFEAVVQVDKTGWGCSDGPDGGMRDGGRGDLPDPEGTHPGVRLEVAVGDGTGRPADRGVRLMVRVQRLDTHRRRAARAEVVLSALAVRLGAEHRFPKAGDTSF